MSTTSAPPRSAPPPARRRPRHRVRLVAGAVVVVLVVVAVVAATRPSVQATPFESPLAGKVAPAISGRDLGGGSFDLASYRGRWVVVNFFASWCPPCAQEEPGLVAFAFQQEHRHPGAAVVSVVFHDADAAARQFLAVNGAQWPAVPDPGGAIANAYGVGSPPTTFLIDPRGVVAGALEGPVTARQLDGSLTRAGAR